MHRAWWIVALLVPAASGCLDVGKDYRVEHVWAVAWINGVYDYEDIRGAFSDLGFKVDESDMPEVVGTNDTMTLRSLYTRGMDARLHPGTWTLTATYRWDEDRFGKRQWHDEDHEARHEGQPLWNSARWHFHGFLEEVTALHSAWAGTPDRSVQIILEERADYAEPKIE